ncbi:hypothetical protein D9615_009257 [Tricholomella constricta]|uniref:Uncharacterized protein n=1 Tax=Tricholomella constricta TaxID=117010 RepID=A0A8H5LWQ8_9AGAR|nr:hypothetical protein D9615_009257 [Tricholomella constricta]
MTTISTDDDPDVLLDFRSLSIGGHEPSQAPILNASRLYDGTETPSAFLERILVKEKQPVLLVGESSNMSTTCALAAMRGSLHGIWASHYADLAPVPFSQKS